VVLYTKTSKLF